VTAAVLSVVTPATAQAPPPEVVVDGLDFPAGIAFTSEGTMVVTERPGRVRVIENGRLRERPLAEIPTTTTGETGLLGIAVDPSDDAVFVFATEPDGSSNSVWRVPLGGGEPERVVTDLPAAVYHNGGGVGFDHDGMLLVSNGEQHSSERSQDPNVSGGKVYRFTPEGGVPSDNPFGDNPTFALGLRNPYGLAVDPVSGDVWVTENGPENWDEVNRVPAGSNLGWPVVSGPREGGESGAGSLGPGDYLDPAFASERIIVPTGIAFAGQGALRRHRDALFFGAYGDSTIRRAVLTEDREDISGQEVFLSESSPVVALAWGPEGLYYSTQEGAIKLVRLVQDDPRESPEVDEAHTPEAQPTPPRESGEPGGRPVWVVVLLLLFAGGYAFMRRRLMR
jgi:glucose/arabinose dehydrogenase